MSAVRDFSSVRQSATAHQFPRQIGTATVHQKVDEKSGLLSILIVLGPAILWLIGFAVAQLARLKGCKIWAKGPEECIILGADIGEFIYPLWSLGFYLLFVFLWVPIGLIILGILRFARR